MTDKIARRRLRPEKPALTAAVLFLVVLILLTASTILLLLDSRLRGLVDQARTALDRAVATWEIMRLTGATGRPHSTLAHQELARHTSTVLEDPLLRARYAGDTGNPLVRLEGAWSRFSSQSTAGAAEDLDVMFHTLRQEAFSYFDVQRRYFRNLVYCLGIATLLLAGALVATRQRQVLRRASGLRSRELARHLIQEYETRINTVALDLHDDIAQDLHRALTDLQDSGKAARGFVRSAIEKVRALSHDLRPGAVAALSLESSLRALCREVSDTTCLPVRFHSVGAQRLALPYLVKVHVYRVVQEALSNAARHAGETAATVTLIVNRPGSTQSGLLVRVQDWGSGIESVSQAVEREGCLGLRGMQERAALVSGVLRLVSRSGEGTTVVMRVPLQEDPTDPS